MGACVAEVDGFENVDLTVGGPVGGVEEVEVGPEGVCVSSLGVGDWEGRGDLPSAASVWCMENVEDEEPFVVLDFALDPYG